MSANRVNIADVINRSGISHYQWQVFGVCWLIALKDAAELYRRMVFNALISNTDDYPRNHAAIAKGEDWQLSPAYDLTPSMPISLQRRDLAMSCGDFCPYAHAENLLSQRARFHLEREAARAIIDRMEEHIKTTWYETARREGVSEKDCETIKSAFAYPGFRLQLEDRPGA